jgi:hypothetical protein
MIGNMLHLVRAALVFIALAWSAGANAAVTVTAQLERSTMMVGETMALSVVVEGAAPQGLSETPTIPGLSMQFRGNSQKITSINGQTSIQHILSYGITGTQIGQYTIPPIQVTVGGNVHSTLPVTVTVTKADVSAQSRYENQPICRRNRSNRVAALRSRCRKPADAPTEERWFRGPQAT